ncbi:MAG: hypothetical protein OHK003_17300 [Anaerolineales bacterium]
MTHWFGLYCVISYHAVPFSREGGNVNAFREKTHRTTKRDKYLSYQNQAKRYFTSGEISFRLDNNYRKYHRG